ncbi:MAG: HAD-IA family hydrolase [Candidatus Bathyarchaeia archaeon]
MQTKAVIFDLDDTLISSGIDYKKAKSSVISFLVESGVTDGLLSESMSNLEIINRAIEDLHGKNFTEAMIRRIIDRVYAMFNEAELRALERARPMDGSMETLAALKDLGLRIGVVTNSCSAYARRVLKTFSLDKYIDVLFARDEVPRHKPDPEHLLRALEALGVHSSEAVFVGDHLIDALCARDSGVKFILLRNKKWYLRDAEKNAFAVINHLSELPALLQRI